MVHTITKFYGTLLITLAVYSVSSKFIFDKVYNTTQIVIDELFHIPQGILYCEGNFSHWDPKITTLPGLYLISSIVGFFSECNTYNLRFVNLIASSVNFLIFASIIKYIFYYSYNSKFQVSIQALSLSIFPPLYFFSHVYYTEILSFTFLLLFTRLCFTNGHKLLILIFGLLSILMRQTNVVWIAMMFGHKFLDTLIKSFKVYGPQLMKARGKRSRYAISYELSKLKRYYDLTDVCNSFVFHLRTCFKTFFWYLNIHEVTMLLTQLFILLIFSTFVYFNGSIVVGDKSAHEATIHMPQLLYFLIFYGFFGLPYVVSMFFSTLKLIYENILTASIFTVIFTVIVYFNTQVHPYLLADNRHFMFYIWNRWYGKYDYAVYATVPVYVFLLFSLYDNLRENNCVSFLLPYSVALTLVLALQKLVEIRYFLLPYIILRLRFPKPDTSIIIAELVWYAVINTAAFSVFFNKEVHWQDFDYVQRIIW